MTRATLALLGVLVALHWREGVAATALPLSAFRDGHDPLLGYAAFALLILMGAIMARAAYRGGEFSGGLVYSVAIVMLVAIAATPSFDALHVLISLLLPFLIHVYYSWLLHSVLGRWSVLHIFVPLLLLLTVQFHSFGAWQKSLIMYFLLLANVHYRFLPQAIRKKSRQQVSTKRDFERLIAEGWIDKGRKCHSVHP